MSVSVAKRATTGPGVGREKAKAARLERCLESGEGKLPKRAITYRVAHLSRSGANAPWLSRATPYHRHPGQNCKYHPCLSNPRTSFSVSTPDSMITVVVVNRKRSPGGPPTVLPLRLHLHSSHHIILLSSSPSTSRDGWSSLSPDFSKWSRRTYLTSERVNRAPPPGPAGPPGKPPSHPSPYAYPHTYLSDHEQDCPNREYEYSYHEHEYPDDERHEGPHFKHAYLDGFYPPASASSPSP